MSFFSFASKLLYDFIFVLTSCRENLQHQIFFLSVRLDFQMLMFSIPRQIFLLLLLFPFNNSLFFIKKIELNFCFLFQVTSFVASFRLGPLLQKGGLARIGRSHFYLFTDGLVTLLLVRPVYDHTLRRHFRERLRL